MLATGTVGRVSGSGQCVEGRGCGYDCKGFERYRVRRVELWRGLARTSGSCAMLERDQPGGPCPPGRTAAAHPRDTLLHLLHLAPGCTSALLRTPRSPRILTASGRSAITYRCCAERPPSPPTPSFAPSLADPRVVLPAPRCPLPASQVRQAYLACLYPHLLG